MYAPSDLKRMLRIVNIVFTAPGKMDIMHDAFPLTDTSIDRKTFRHFYDTSLFHGKKVIASLMGFWISTLWKMSYKNRVHDNPYFPGSVALAYKKTVMFRVWWRYVRDQNLPHLSRDNVITGPHLVHTLTLPIILFAGFFFCPSHSLLRAAENAPRRIDGN